MTSITERVPMFDEDAYLRAMEKIKAAGLAYANGEITDGFLDPLPDPLESDGLDGQEILGQAGIAVEFTSLELFEQDDIRDTWTEGYRSAPWPDKEVK